MNLHILLLFLNYKYSVSTVDISLPELEYIANHLDPDECWKLVILLHSNSYELSNGTLPNRRQPIITDLNCLEQLLHWNSQMNEGFDATNDILAHRLRQINRIDLSDWLSRTVFNELSKELNKTLLSDPFKSQLINATTEVPDFVGNDSLKTIDVENVWKPYDTILTVTIVLLFVTCIFLSFQIVSVSVRSSKRKNHKTDYKDYVPLVTRKSVSYNNRHESSTSEIS